MIASDTWFSSAHHIVTHISSSPLHIGSFLCVQSYICSSYINKSFVIKWVTFFRAQNCYELPSLWSGVTSFPVKTLNCHISRTRPTRIPVFALNWDLVLSYLARICAVWSSRGRAGKKVTAVTFFCCPTVLLVNRASGEQHQWHGWWCHVVCRPYVFSCLTVIFLGGQFIIYNYPIRSFRSPYN